MKPFCEIGKLSKGKGLLKEDIKRSGSIPAIPYTALYTDYSEVLDYSLIKWFIDDETQSVIVREPCLLLASSSNMEANTGKASALVGTTPVAIGREVIVFKTSSDCKFISYLLSTPFYRRKTLTLARGTTIKHVYPATFQDYQVAHPPLPEQRAIAAALGDVDALIGGLDKLIAKKRDLKQAAMQQLLTGKQRLPGFESKLGYKQTEVGLVPDDWRIETVGEISTVGRGRVISHREITAVMNPLYPVYSSQTSDKGIMGYIDTFDFDGEYITWTTDGANAGTVFLRNGRFNCTNVCGTIKLKRDNAGFVSRVLAGIMPRYVSRNLGNPKLMNDVAKRIPVPLPPDLAEQTAIATVLSDMDAEIAALETRRDKTRALTNRA